MVDKEALMDKIESGTFGIEDLEDYLTLFLEISNESEDIQEEVEGWNRVLQIKLSDTDNFWLKIEEGKFTAGKGDAGESDITLEMSGETAAGVFTGEIDATSAYMSGDLKIIGPLPDAVKFRTLTELVREELEE
ncbi:MAG: SCP2 sterol-binding domain-containing protein [Promethearchaeota archaeon]